MTDPGRFFLCSYWPLAKTLGGRRAVEAYALPPYANGMSRREPDFEHPMPALTSSSRGRGFVPRLAVGDTVVFTTTKGRWGTPVRGAHWRLVAVLEVARRFETHAEAAAWYASEKMRPPGNLVIDGNPPLPVPLTIHHGKPHDGDWDAVCVERAAECSIVLACETRVLDLYSPPPIVQDDWLALFGTVPNTRTPPEISEAQFDSLLALADERRQREGLRRAA